MSDANGADDTVDVGSRRQARNGLFTIEDIQRFIDTIRGEAMELVETAPEQYRSEFGAGMAHGYLKSANRFSTLADESLGAQQAREEAFDRNDI